jgi:hypothetical protein
LYADRHISSTWLSTYGSLGKQQNKIRMVGPITTQIRPDILFLFKNTD